MPDHSRRQADVVVVGAGVAGLRAALALAPLRVVLLTKAAFGEGGSSPFAQGGIAAAVGADDSPRLHAEDTLQVGGGLNRPEAVELLTREAPAEIRELEARGTHWDRTADGSLDLGREGGHHRRRVVHAGGDATGLEMIRALSAAVRRQRGVEIWERTFAVELVSRDGRVCGVLADTGGGARLLFEASAIVLATGGAGQVYRATTNPPESTGDGVALAARAGASLVDLEFIQFHPTALDSERDPLPLLTEALRGEGARLIDERGERFLVPIHADAELAPRDIVARAIFEHQQAGHRTFLDVREHPGAALAERFPTVAQSCREAGIDPLETPLPVTPAAHYLTGGVETDLQGRTHVPGLWACGETAATGAHGANRLASNSLLEAVVFGTATAHDILGRIEPLARRDAESRLHRGSWRPQVDSENRSLLRDTMWRLAGLTRNASGLEEAGAVIDELARRPGNDGELRNLLVVARGIVAAALAREETRGSHYRSDFPRTEPRFARHLPSEPGAKERTSATSATSA